MADIIQLMLLSLIINKVGSSEIIYYIAAVEEMWDYAPSGKFLINQTMAGNYLNAEAAGSSHVYRKAMFREFTDNTFRIPKQHPEYLGILGPTLTVFAGDVLTIHFKNKATNSHSIHPTGLQYTKNNEGSNYEDGTTGIGKGDNAIPPGETYVYSWNITSTDGPQLNDPDCVTSLYYSDVSYVKDINSGLVGFILVCKRVSSDNSKNIPLLFNVFDEHHSLYNHDEKEEKIDNKLRYSINGLSFGNMPPLAVCANDNVTIHTAGFGRSQDIHSVKVLGHPFIHKGQRHDSLLVYPGGSTSASIFPTEPGKWLITSLNKLYAQSGMQALLSVSDCGTNPTKVTVTGKVRRYYIAVEEVINRSNGRPYKSFVEYDGNLFLKNVTRLYGNIHGTLGPLITAEVGDTIKAVFVNRDDQPHSILPNGVRVHKSNEGAFYNDGGGYSPVPPDGYKTYFWTIPEFFGPTSHDLPCIPRYYTSGVDSPSSGLIGPILICRQGMLDDRGQLISNTKHTFLFYNEQDVNGFTSSRDIQSIKLAIRQKAAVHMMYIGGIKKTEVPVVRINNIPFRMDGLMKYSVSLTPEQFQSVEIQENSHGTFQIESDFMNVAVPITIGHGVNTLDDSLFGTPKATHFIGIDEREWDYSNKKISNDDWKRNTGSKLGPKYKKALYREYDSDMFFWERDSSYLYGPVIKTVIGQTYKIIVKNLATRAYSIYSPGVVIKRQGVNNGEMRVEPEEEATFLWSIPASVGPGPAESNCVVRPYYSNVDRKRDINSGLIGPLIVCRDDLALQDDQSSSVLIFQAIEEIQSWYINHTIHDHIKKGNPDLSTDLVTNPEFIKTNRIYAINGFAEGTVNKIEQLKGNGITIHLMNAGSQHHTIHFHGATVVNSDRGLHNGQNVIPLSPSSTTSINLLINNEGKWQYESMCTNDRLRRLYGIIWQFREIGPVS